MGEMTKSQVVRFSVPGLAPAAWSGNSRSHWRTKHADGDEYAMWVWLAWGGSHETKPGCCDIEGAPWPRAKLTLTQKAIRLRDTDNFLASFKPGLDTLTTKGKRPLSIILDDSPECLSIEVKSERVQHKADECVVVEITRLEEPMSEQDAR